MLILEGFGRSGDMRRIHDYHQDTPKLYMRVNVLLLVPLFLVTGFLGIGAIAAVFSQPRREMVLQVPVCVAHLMRVARARESGARSAFGPTEAKLRLGIKKVYVEDQERLKFSMNAADSVPYDANVKWV